MQQDKPSKNYQITLAALVVSVAYYIGAKIGLALSFKPDYIAALWPPNAVLLFALLISRPKYWWCFLVASIPAELAADIPSGIPWKMVVGFLAGDWVEALTGAVLLRLFFKFDDVKLISLKQGIIFLACCVFVAPFIAAFVGALTPLLGDLDTGYWSAWRSWFFGDALTHLTITSTLLVWLNLDKKEFEYFSGAAVAEAAFATVLLTTVSFITFSFTSSFVIGLPVYLYLPIPILLWIAVRFGTRGIFTAALLVSVIAIWTASHGSGPFSTQTLEKNVLNLQVFLLVGFVPLVLLASLIVERRHFEQQLVLFRELIDHSYDAIFVVDPKTSKFLDVNSVACTRLGYSREELLNKGVTDINHDLSDSHKWEKHAKSLCKKKNKVFESHHVRENGSQFPVEISTSYTSNQGKEFIISVARDITDRKKTEEKLLTNQKLESVGILAGGIAHDFNNLLMAIIGNISMAKLQIKPEDEAYKKLVDSEKASLRARDLTQQLLTFSKGGAPVTEASSVADIVKESANFILSGSKIKSKFSIEDDIWSVEVDEGQISQVVQNLVKNAEQEMPEGGTIEIAGRNVQVEQDNNLDLAEGRYVEISVTDQGQGIPEKHIQLIFDPYFTTKQKGNGLGLATAFSIIKNHNGLLTAESILGKGATFKIYVPASDKKIQEVTDNSTKLEVGTGRILVMDDELEVRNVLDSMLSNLGYEVVLSEEGGEALESYRKALKEGKPFDVVILDLTVQGGLGGKETVGRLLDIHPDVKAIVSSGYANDPVMAEYTKFGFSGVIRKPFRIQDLSSLLSTILKH